MGLTFFTEGSELGGRYTLERRLGSGGMATVWVATDATLRRRVAVKLPSDVVVDDPSFARRFEREARTAAAVSHPNLVPVYDYGVEEDRPFLVSELIEGSSLDVLRDRGEPPPTEALAEALLAALARIHAAGIVHRDVKPGNVLVSGERILLTDFGIAQPSDATSLTSTGHVIGTKRYMAPEVSRGRRAGPAADLYACGVVLSEQLTDADPGRLHRLVDSLRAEDPDDRPRSAEAALEALEASTPGPTEPHPGPTAPAPLPPPEPEPVDPLGPERVLAGRDRTRPPLPPDREAGGRNWRPLAIGLLLAAAAAVVLVIALSGGDQEGGGERSAQRNSTSSEPSTQTTTEETTVTETAEAPAPAPDPAEEVPSGDGVALNEQGKALLDSGDYDAAVPILQQAVEAFPEGTDDINYAYALFNYGQALRLSGDPEAAIPVLEERLQIPNQTGVVKRELELAREDAG